MKEALTICIPESSPLRKESPCVIPEIEPGTLSSIESMDDLSQSLGFLIWSHG